MRGLVLVGVVAFGSTASAQFVEDSARVLWVAHCGEEAGDQFGWQCEAIGDLTGDGVSEIAASAPFSSQGEGPGRHGKVFILDGRSGETVTTLLGTRPGGGFGFRLYSAGDFDRDGTPDYVVTEAGVQGPTAPDQTGPGFRGYVHVMSGADHRPLRVFAGPDEQARMGMAAAVLDDLDGDGTAEILAGGCQADHAGKFSGSAYLFHGEDGTLLRRHDGPGAGALFGSGLTRIDDVSGDGVCEYAIAAYGEGEERKGRVHVFDGATGQKLYSIDPNEDSAGETSIDFGRFFLSQAGDIDQDGMPDLYIVDWFDQCAGAITGRVWMVSAEVPPEGESPRVLGTIDGTVPGEWLGYGRAFPDVDGDDSPEMLICSDGIDRFAGAVGLYSGATGERLRWIQSKTPGHAFAYDACSPGDLDGDGIADLIVTSAGNQGDGKGAFGSVYAIAGLDHRVPDGSDDGGG